MEARHIARPTGTAAFEAVVLVSSAGGLEAVSRILADLPADLPTAIVVMQHLSAHGSTLVEILRRRTPLPVHWIEEGDALAPGQVQVAPAGKRLEILPDRTFALSSDRARARDLVLDELLRSAADSMGARVLALVLTGMGRDGASGALAVKQAGGSVIVQSEDTADQPAMPRAAIAAGAASLIAPLREIGTLVTKVVRGAPLPRSTEELIAIASAFGESGDVADFVRTVHWPGHPLGPVHTWPPQLRDTVRLVVENPDPAQLLWGASRLVFFNDASAATFGGRWRSMFGHPYDEAFPDLPEARRLQARVLDGERVRLEHAPFSYERNGRVVDGWFDVAYTPVYGRDGSVAGVHSVWVDRTREILAARRLEAVNRLASAPTAADRRASLEQLIARLADGGDVPFACAYEVDAQGCRADLAASLGVPAGSALAPTHLPISYEAVWPIREAIDGRRPLLLENLEARFPGCTVPGTTPAPACAMLYPLSDEAEGVVVGVLILGINPRLPLDDLYRQFLNTVADTISAKSAESHARHRERQRLERMNELDRAKTEFFSNVSHEFRTPLTLMLAPLEELQRRSGEVPHPLGDEVAVAAANARRLLTLVDTLLDFSQAEAGRLRAHFAPTDLATLTADIAAVFRSAAERAGLEYSVDCPALEEPVWIDRAMWEKIVSNLLSNALKFTLEGEIAVRLRDRPGHAELIVSDTGVGIPPAEQPHVFKRFHRVRAPRARTHEGSGIGLALVHELVRLHHGRIRIKSVEGKGSTFTVWLPHGKRAADDESIEGEPELHALRRTAAALAREAERWVDGSVLPEGVLRDTVREPDGPLLVPHAPDARILVVDDNADMRQYLRRLLARRWRVDVAPDGEQALASMRAQKPDLVVADVMMPNLDGFALLRAVRDDEALKQIPVVLVTARAGEEAAIEGLIAGADDYIAKPFSSRELVARLGGQLEIARTRHRVTELNGFLVGFSDAARGLTDPRAVEELACRMLVDQLGIDRAHWAEIDWTAREFAIMGACQVRGVPVIEGRFPLDAWEAFMSAQLAGRSLVVEDAQRDPRIPEAVKESYARFEIGAELAIPVAVGGTLRCVFAVNQRQPRRWTPEEIALVEGVAGRCWAEIERARVEAALRQRTIWMRRQSEALEAAVAGAPLERSLGALVRAATEALGEGTRAAIYLANDGGTTLHHVVGMPADYARAVDGFKIGPESLACGLATAMGTPVLTADVMVDPRWEPWRGLAVQFDYRGCWSFPLNTATGTFVGTLAIYWRQPRAAAARELELAAALTHTASLILARHAEAAGRRRAEDALRARERAGRV